MQTIAPFLVHLWSAEGAISATYVFIGDLVPLPSRKSDELLAQHVPKATWQKVQRLRKTAPVHWVYQWMPMDERADVACKRILMAVLGRRKIESGEGLVAWRDSGPVLFKWSVSGPSSPFENAIAAGARVSTERTWIGRAPLNIALLSDLPADSPFVWPVQWSKVKSPTDSVVRSLLVTQGRGAAASLGFRFAEVVWTATTGGPLNIEAVFAQLHASAHVPLIQWVDDIHHVLYKLYRAHTIPEGDLKERLDYGRIHRSSTMQGARLVMTVAYGGSMGKLIVSATGTIELRMHPRVEGDAAMKEYERGLFAVLKPWLSNALGMKPRIGVSLMTLRTSVALDSAANAADLRTWMEGLSAYMDFTQVRRVAASGAARPVYLLQWLRASNYVASVDIANVVSARLNLGVDVDSIVEDLVEGHGFAPADARALVEASIDALDAPPEVVGKPAAAPAVVRGARVSMGMTVTIGLSVNGNSLELLMRDVPSHDDAAMAMMWLNGMLASVQQQRPNTSRTSPVQSPVAGPSQPAPALVDVAALEEDPFALSMSSSANSSGGGLGGSGLLGGGLGGSGLLGGGLDFLADLKKADAKLFGKQFSKKCQSASNSQPMVLSKAAWAALPQQYKETVTNHVEYGSDPSVAKHNVYFCPTVWCPDDKVPLSEPQYKAAGNKCPNGKAGIQVWDNAHWKKDPEKKRYLGFNAKSMAADAKEPCLLCCYGKPPAPAHEQKCRAKVLPAPPASVAAKSATATAATAATMAAEHAKPSNYLLTHPAPLPKDRWGTLPKTLHMVLHPPTLLHGQCSQQVTSKPCLLRRGILHGTDSFMHAVGHLVGEAEVSGSVNQRSALLKKLMAAVTPEVFVSLEDGQVLAAFVGTEGIVSANQPALVKKWLAWIGAPAQRAYVRLFRLKDVVAAAAAGSASIRLQRRVSRELSIYKAYVRFQTYLQSSEAKDASLLVDAIRRLGVHLVIWERDAADPEVVHMRCPSAVPYSALPLGGAGDANVAMLLHDQGFYEPIELSKPLLSGVGSGPGSGPVTPTGAVKDLMAKCEAAPATAVPATHAWVEHARAIDAALDLALLSEYRWKHCIVSPDLAIVGLLTRNKRYVPCGRVPILALLDLVAVVPSITVMYQEDWGGQVEAGGTVDGASEGDVAFAAILRAFGLGEATASEAPIIDAPPMIPVLDSKDIVGKQRAAKDAGRRKWAAARWMVGRKMLQEYERHVEPFLAAGARTRQVFVQVALDLFPDKAPLIEEALVEMPLGTPEAIEGWMRQTGEDVWPFLSYEILTDKRYKEWLFSQLAVQRGLPEELLRPVRGARPRRVVVVRGAFGLLWGQANSVRRISRPAMLADAKPKKLPWKWADARLYSWRDWPIQISASATQADRALQAWLAWAARECSIPTNASLLTLAMRVYLAGTVAGDRVALELLCKQPGVLDALRSLASVPKSASLSKAFDMIMAAPLDTRVTWLVAAFANLPYNDLHLSLWARLTGVTVMIVSNVDYGKKDANVPLQCADFKADDVIEVCATGSSGLSDPMGPSSSAQPKVARGSTKDLISCAVLLCNEEWTREDVWRRPFVFLYKEVASVATAPPASALGYAPIGQGLWTSLRHAPADLQHVACCLWKHAAWRRAH